MIYMARLSFDSVFQIHQDGSIEPRQRVRVSGIEFGRGVRLGHGLALGGIDLTRFKDRDLEVETDDSTIVIKGIYSPVAV